MTGILWKCVSILKKIEGNDIILVLSVALCESFIYLCHLACMSAVSMEASSIKIRAGLLPCR
jgi:hypothetical protein